MENTENKRLRLIRKALGYNQNDFAKSIGLTQGGYSDIERGKNGISKQIKQMLVLVHKINLAFLEKEKGEMFFIETPTDSDEFEATDTETKDKLIALLQANIKRLSQERDLYIDLLKSKNETIERLEELIKK
uniref:helix-turn-helix domain-containing protein n=1 Tax=Pedobacter sp. TaxID=1411316 RepID=UPI001599C4DF|nr:helix-turn-helix transcriptional regulator [Pedobacter sp.]QJS06230.1 transcriptional regulator, XRE family [Pedobacter sp.]